MCKGYSEMRERFGAEREKAIEICCKMSTVRDHERCKAEGENGSLRENREK